MFDAPPRAGQSWSAVRASHGMCSSYRHAVASPRAFELCRCGPGHQSAGQGAGDRERHAQPQGPAQCAVSKRLPPECDGDSNCRQRLDDNREPHGGEQHAVEDRTDVEVARGAAECLKIDDHDLEQQRHRRHPAHDRSSPAPLGDEGEDPREREAVDRDRGGEFRRFEPCRRTADDAGIDHEGDSRGGECSHHEEPQGRQPRVCLPKCCERIFHGAFLLASGVNVIDVNINIAEHVDIVNMPRLPSISCP